MSKFHDIARGYIKVKDDGTEQVNFYANQPKSKTKLIVQMEDGSQYECSKFFMMENKNKTEDWHGDKRLVFVLDQ